MALFYNLEIGYMFQFVKITKRKPLPYRVELECSSGKEAIQPKSKQSVKSNQNIPW
jgi:hypothetical protein